jgi:8-oxo-dGTP diphosphatase
MDKDVARVYGNKVRVRACGLCFQEQGVLMVNHKGITNGDFWAPPGGGIEFGDSIEKTLVKEFEEETRLRIQPGEFRFGCEYINDPIHSIELFYLVNVIGGELRTGKDPELQIIDNVKFLTLDELKKISLTEVHGIFRFVNSLDDLKSIRGFYRI